MSDQERQAYDHGKADAMAGNNEHWELYRNDPLNIQRAYLRGQTDFRLPFN